MEDKRRILTIGAIAIVGTEFMAGKIAAAIESGGSGLVIVVGDEQPRGIGLRDVPVYPIHCVDQLALSMVQVTYKEIQSYMQEEEINHGHTLLAKVDPPLKEVEPRCNSPGVFVVMQILLNL